MSNKIYPFSALTGGANDSYLDYHDGNNLADGDQAFGIAGGIQYAYLLDADSGASESAPYVIAPDTNPGDKRWILQVPGGAFSHVEATTTAGQSIASGSDVTVVFGTEDRDDLGEYNNATGVFTAGAAGTYLVSGSVVTGTTSWTATHRMSIDLKKNGSVVKKGYRSLVEVTVSGLLSSNISTSIQLTATDTISLSVNHNQGSAISLLTTAGYNWLTIDRIA